MKRPTIIITVLAIVLGASGAVYAYGKHGHWNMTPQEKVEFVTDRVSKELNLDDQQRENFATLADTVAQLMVEARSGKSQNLAEIKQLLEEPSFNQARALELVQQKTDMINNRAPLVVSQLAIFLDSLNTEQKRQLQSHLEHRRQHHWHDHETD